MAVARIPARAEELLLALEDTEDFNSLKFHGICKQNGARAEGYSFDELLDTLPKKYRARLATALNARARLAAAKLAEALESAQSESQDQDSAEPKEAAGVVLHGAAVLARLLLLECGSALPPDLLSVSTLLHDEALLRADFSPALQEAVAKLCESWWQCGHSERERLVAQTMPYLLVKSLTSGKQADVKRVHAMRAALLLLDFDDDSIVSLKRLLLRCAFAPEYLRCAEGRRFLSALFCLQPQLSKELQAIVRNQIPSGRKSVLQAYGEILFRAWRTAAGPCLAELEYGCVQGLAKACLHARTPAMAASLRSVLDGFHSQKSVKGVDEMLLRVYEPILFRSLQAANPAVRENAAQLLFACFPLQNPEAAHEDIDEALSQQFQHAAALLKDPCPKMRASAVRGVVALLDAYWELIPPATTAGFIACIVDDLVHDASSSEVRAEAVAGLAKLVHNPLAQPVLKAVLPRLKGLLFDVTQRVRLALVDLLIEVRSVRAVRFYEVVPLELLLTSLATDAPAVQRRLTRLLLPSYCPAGGTMEQVADRCVALLEQQPEAGAVLCRYMVSEGAPAGTALALAESLQTLLLNSKGPEREDEDDEGEAAPAPLVKPAAKQPKKKGGRRRKAAEIEAEVAPEDAAPEAASSEHVVPPGIWETIAGGVAGLAESLVGQLPRAKLVELFRPEAVTTLLQKAPTQASLAAVLRAAQTVPANAAGSLKLQCQSRLLAPLGGGEQEGGSTSGLSETELHGPELLGWLRCMCVWDGAAELASHLELALEGPGSQSEVAAGNDKPKRGRAAKRQQEAAEPASAASSTLGIASRDLAYQYLTMLLEDETCRDKLLAGGHLARLLPRLRVAAGEAARAAGSDAAYDEEGEGVAAARRAAAAMLAYAKSAIHVDLEGKTRAPEDSDSPAQEPVAAVAVESMCAWVGPAFAELCQAATAYSDASAKAPAESKKARKGSRNPAAPANSDSGPCPRKPSKAWGEGVGLLVNATLASSAEAAALGLVTDELAAAHLDGACCLGKEVMSWLHAEHQATRRGRSVFPSKLVCSLLGHVGRLAHRLLMDAASRDSAAVPENVLSLSTVVLQHMAGWVVDEEDAGGPFHMYIPELVSNLTKTPKPDWMEVLASQVTKEQYQDNADALDSTTSKTFADAVATRKLKKQVIAVAINTAIACWKSGKHDVTAGAVDLALAVLDLQNGSAADAEWDQDAMLSEDVKAALLEIRMEAEDSTEQPDIASVSRCASHLVLCVDRLFQHGGVTAISAA